MRHRRVVVAVVVVAVVFLGYRLVRRSTGLAVQTAEVTSGPIVREVVASGALQPKRLVEVGSQVSGTIQSLDADFNTPVRAGQVIARIDPLPYRTQLIEAEGRLGQAQAGVL